MVDRLPTNRFVFQVECCQLAGGRVLNMGCKEDPAKLKRLFTDVVNVDIRDYDDDVYRNKGERVPIPVDLIHDMTRVPWPFHDREFAIVVLGDVLEDLPDDGCQVTILREARRVGHHLCVTCPVDSPDRDWHHRTTITKERLADWLYHVGWSPIHMQDVDYGFVPHGTLVFAQ